MPPWGWDHIQTFALCANVSGPLSPAALAAFKPHGFVVISKVQQMANPPVNRSGEQKIYKQAKMVHNLKDMQHKLAGAGRLLGFLAERQSDRNRIAVPAGRVTPLEFTTG